jgi:hypothetical protein
VFGIIGFKAKLGKFVPESVKAEQRRNKPSRNLGLANSNSLERALADGVMTLAAAG